ncbi:MAG: extracellular solute-binding protein [Acidimicrobiales bacterium]
MGPQADDHFGDGAAPPETTPAADRMSRRRFLGLGAGAAAAVAGARLKVPGAASGARSSSRVKPTSINILDDNANQVFLKGGIAEFERQTGIKVASYEQLGPKELAPKLATLLASQSSSYDVVMTWAALTAEFGAPGWFHQLSAADVPADLLDGPRDAVTWAGAVYGVPKFASVQTMFYNKALFAKAGLDPDKAPMNWVELVQAATELTRPPFYGYVNDMGSPEGAYQNFLRTLLCTGGEMWDSKYNVLFNSPAGINALTKLVDLFSTQKVADPASLRVTGATDLGPIFASGAAAIMFDWPYGYGAARQKMSAKDIGNAIIPGVTVRSASIDGSEGFAINAFSNQKSAALEWLRFAASPYVQRRMVLEEGWLPVTSNLLQEPDLVAALPVVATYAEQSKYMVKRYGAPWYDGVCEGYLGANVTNAVLGKLSPTAALDQAASDCQTLIDACASLPTAPCELPA